MSNATRAHETRVVIDAPIEEVWKAITDASELSRWFAPKMTVQPGAGGFVVADWGPGLAWKTFIEVWEPNRHLRTVETRDRILSSSPVEERLEPCRLVQDYYLEAEGGQTVLRLVHSGFGSSAAWDREYEGTRGGWASCFFRLRQALEGHRNDRVHNLLLPALCYGVEAARALQLIESVAPRSLETVRRGQLEFCGCLPERNGSILTVSVQPTEFGSVAYLELLLFGLPDAESSALENEWRTKLAELFPAPSGNVVRGPAAPPAPLVSPVTPC